MTTEKYTPKYLNGKGKYQRDFDNLFALLVTVGKADTIDGKALQALNILYAERFKKTDWDMLPKECNVLRTYLFNNNFDIGDCLFSKHYTDKALDALVDTVVKHIRSKYKVEVVITDGSDVDNDKEWRKAIKLLGIQCHFVNEGESDLAVYVLSTYKMTKAQANEVSLLLKR